MVDQYEPPVFYLNDKEKLVKALGIQLPCEPKDIRILVNGIDLMKSLVIDSIVVTVEKKVEKTQ